MKAVAHRVLLITHNATLISLFSSAVGSQAASAETRMDYASDIEPFNARSRQFNDIENCFETAARAFSDLLISLFS